jgi:membrane-bound inhibitor of C-type lysozyme
MPSQEPIRKSPAVERTSVTRALVVLALAAWPTGVLAEITLPIPGTEPVERFTVPYSCEGLEPFSVEYINAGANALALVPVEGETLVFANVLSASGARYAAGPFVWWTRGRSADLYDIRQGEDAAPIASCTEAGN